MNILVTGGAGFIGANFVNFVVSNTAHTLVNLDKLTYAGNLGNLTLLAANPRHIFVHGDIGDQRLTGGLLQSYQPHAIVNVAAESHVDRSISAPAAFIHTNVVGTFNLLQQTRNYWEKLPDSEKKSFRFLHVSTDEVYGSLGQNDPAFTELTPYAPNSPYSASKASSDHLVRAYHHTYGLPTLITNCSNNYGPYQFPEKLIPLAILNIIEQRPIPVCGDGRQVRDWLFVLDHCEALLRVLEAGTAGATYNVGGDAERRNIDIIHLLCDMLDQRLDRNHSRSSRRLIEFVTDRPGHDRRYAINAGKIRRELNWRPRFTMEQGLTETVDWYMSHKEWLDSVRTGDYRNWIAQNYGKRPAADASAPTRV